MTKTFCDKEIKDHARELTRGGLFEKRSFCVAYMLTIDDWTRIFDAHFTAELERLRLNTKMELNHQMLKLAGKGNSFDMVKFSALKFLLSSLYEQDEEVTYKREMLRQKRIQLSFLTAKSSMTWDKEVTDKFCENLKKINDAMEPS